MPVNKNGNSKGEKKKRGWVIFAAGCAVLTGGIVLLLVIYLAVGWQSYQDAPKIVSEVESDILITEEYDLGQDQMDAYLEYGFPEAFRILFYDEMLPDGSIVPVRLESWTYYGQGVEFSFLNGEKTGLETLNNPQLGNLILPPTRRKSRRPPGPTARQKSSPERLIPCQILVNSLRRSPRSLCR